MSTLHADLAAPPQQRRPTRFRWAVVGMLCAVGFVLYVDRINISVAVRSMKEEFDFSEQVRGNILGAFLFGYAVGLLPGGWLADRFGPRRVLTIAALLWAGLSVLMGFTRQQVFGVSVDPVSTLVTLRFLLGICEACAFPTFNRALANWMCRSERALASGLIHSGSVLGGAFTPLFITFIIAHFGWRQSFVISGELTLAVALLWWLLAADYPAEHKRVSPEELAIIAAGKEELRVEQPDRAWYGRLLRSKNAYLLCLSEFFYGLGGFVFTTWFFSYLKEQRQADEMTAAVLASLIFVAMGIGAPVGGFLCDRCVRKWGSPWGRRTVPLASITLGGCATMIAPRIADTWWSGIVFAIAAGLLFTAASGFWSTLIDITRRGTGVVGGLMNGSGQLGGALGTVAFAEISRALGWSGAVQLSGLMGVIAGLIWLGIDSSRQIDDTGSTA